MTHSHIQGHAHSLRIQGISERGESSNDKINGSREVSASYHIECLQASHSICYQTYQHQQLLPLCCESWFA